MSAARQGPIGTNTVHFTGAGFVPDIGSILADVQGEPDLFAELARLFHRFYIWNESHPQAVGERITQGCNELIGFTIV